MIRYLIDADSALYAMDPERHHALTTRLARCRPGEVAISAVTFAEIAYGTQAGKPPPHEVLAAFVDAVPILAFDEGAARAYAALPFRRARFDRLVAAHAISIAATIVTNNEADFSDIPGLVLENWSLVP